MQNIFTWKFWFASNPPALLPVFFNLFVAVVALFFLVIIVFYFLKRKPGVYQSLFYSLFDFSLANFLVGILLLFFNYERITFFSSRFWLLIWAIGAIAWLVFILLKLKKIPEKKKLKEKEKEFKKYIP
ncbi:MAG: hypothetical protein K9M44_04670 [Candidatus Pacebacteria bacterium]|nr:hypothetical protein [Candidatus Paceibacterota bacterium]